MSGLNLTFVYNYTICMAWRFHFPVREHDFKLFVNFANFKNCLANSMLCIIYLEDYCVLGLLTGQWSKLFLKQLFVVKKSYSIIKVKIKLKGLFSYIYIV